MLYEAASRRSSSNTLFGDPDEDLERPRAGRPKLKRGGSLVRLPSALDTIEREKAASLIRAEEDEAPTRKHKKVGKSRSAY
jgi:hypothetical protein